VPIDVLIAEDEPAILDSLEFILKRAGLICAAVTDGEAVIREVRRQRPRALVLDVMLPKRSGFEVLKLLRADPLTHDLPILVLTARGQAQDRRNAEELGATGFITKPFANAEVVEAVRQMLAPASNG
jgi:two-component system, OmpR family, response regulator